MNKEFSERLLKNIQHEKEQDVKAIATNLKSLPLQKLVSNGLAINNLALENIRSGLAGKIFVELTVNHAINTEIARGDIKAGDIVSIRPSTSGKEKAKSRGKNSFIDLDNSADGIALEIVGTVYKITDQLCSITIEEKDEEDAMKLYSFPKLYIIKTVNTVTYKRMESTLRKLGEFEGTPNNNIIQYLLQDRQFIKQTPKSDIEFNNKALNKSQKDAIAFAMANDISIIHGPPGTGKTYTLIELIQQLVAKGERVLVCGPSNIAVDTILERLDKVLPGNVLLRIGHPARLLEANLAHSLDILSRSGNAGEIVKDIDKDIDKTISDIKKMKNYKDRKEARKLVKDLRRELRTREKKVICDMILEARVVVATLHGAGSRELCSVYDQVPKLFNTLIIDEVSQSLEQQCWIPLISHYRSDISRLVLAGDNKQLPPTIKTEDNKKIADQLSTTLFDRLVKVYGDQFKTLLNVQYRMNESIMEFPSTEMYNGQLIADSSVKTQILSDLPGVDANDETLEPLIWYDTQGDDFLERADDDNEIIASKYNENEAYLVKSHILKLLESNVPQSAIGVISPYRAQISFIKKLIRAEYPGIEISTVDGFQGREKEVIILSLVRSNDDYKVGFLKDSRRLNVAITRSKKQLCVIGNMETLERSKCKFLEEWVKWSSDNTDLRYPDVGELL
ncbi:hypothetical protein TPHA_0N01790 [Tetrapisispora phaffii CBS 4417]|uniref:DNA helicase n=1 Tax=Tetrapisispora phaffii (strain ATCC 24235 / CBS 4417 / NBRC 1672 / NRRL Y-8282 / UCD 70-5) TaxID=1071381 RepID=G8C1D2_TETPH|nr:hypothetical protein TPHA_0N01790 [Tetrapisispora phaffii CBS 4417]CCE65960.1 hypothetical protein TPHA_0N01790 [Tetrapisispora phaffii CBS 4417]